MRRVFSGIQPTGIPHVGNYLGALSHWVRLQEQPPPPALNLVAAAAAKSGPLRDAAESAASNAAVLYCIVDLHAMTASYDPAALREASFTTAAVLLACGIDPARSTLFRQSAVREHAELAWLLSCLTPLGWLQRMTQYKQKSNKSGAGLGLLSYPVLQAADILLYQSTHVPVGEDQYQPLELARDVATAFTARFGTGSSGTPGLFPLPQTVPSERVADGHRIMSLRDGTRKMSKSDADDASRINMTDTADVIAEKVKRAKTDGTHGFTYDPATRPDKSALLLMFSAVTCEPLGSVTERFRDSTSAAFKSALSDALIGLVCPIGAEVRRLQSSAGGRADVEGALVAGEEAARAIACDTMCRVRALTGYR